MTPASLLYRHVHPSWVQDGRVTSMAFRRSAKDEGFLSVYDGDLITLGACWERHTGDLKLESIGIYGVTVGERAGLGLPARLDTESHAAHVLVDFTGYGKKLIERKARELRSVADARGRLFPPQQPQGVPDVAPTGGNGGNLPVPAPVAPAPDAEA